MGTCCEREATGIDVKEKMRRGRNEMTQHDCGLNHLNASGYTTYVIQRERRDAGTYWTG